MFKLKKTLFLGLVVCFIAAGCSGGQNTENTENKENGIGNTAGNLTNYGAAAEYNGDVYCQYGEKGEKLAKMSSNGDVTVLKETMPYFINIYKDKIYFSDANDNFRLHRMDMDGGNEETITESPAYYVNVRNGKIYYADTENDYNMYVMDCKALESQCIVESNCQYINVTDNQIFYSNFSNGGALYCCSLDGSDQIMINSVRSLYVNVVGDYIYYSAWFVKGSDFSDQRVYKMSIEGGNNGEPLNNCASGDINVCGDKIYYTDWDNEKIRVMNTDGSDDKEYDDYGTYINIAGGKMFCVRYVGKTKEMTLNINDLK